MDQMNPNDKTLVFCRDQAHALEVRDIINQLKQVPDVNYCHRVTADDGDLGEQWLSAFQDNDRMIPTILTTSEKLSTGVDALNIRNSVLLRPINSMIEFKQIIGRGTRLFDGKEYFTVYDFVKAHQHFNDPNGTATPNQNQARPEPGPDPVRIPAPKAWYATARKDRRAARTRPRTRHRTHDDRHVLGTERETNQCQ